MLPERTYAIVIALCAGLAWGWALSALGPIGVAAGAGGGAAAGFLGGWAFGRLGAWGERAEPRSRGVLGAVGLLVVLWLGLVILPAVLAAGTWGGLPRPGVRPLID